MADKIILPLIDAELTLEGVTLDSMFGAQDMTADVNSMYAMTLKYEAFPIEVKLWVSMPNGAR